MLEGLSPKGTADSAPIQPSLRGLKPQNLFPSVETLGYSHPSLRDEQDQILVALDRKVCATMAGDAKLVRVVLRRVSHHLLRAGTSDGTSELLDLQNTAYAAGASLALRAGTSRGPGCRFPN
jgi:hypothetical protein